MCDMAEGNPQILKKRELVCDECIIKDGMEIMMMMMNIVFSVSVCQRQPVNF